jgi:hypothetical protein
MPVDQSMVYHVCNPNLVSYQRFINILTKNGYPFNVVSHEAFISQLRTIGNQKDKYVLTGIINELLADQSLYNTPVDCQLTIKLLQQGNFVWENPSESYIINMIR